MTAAAIRRKHPLDIVEAKCRKSASSRRARVSVLRRRMLSAARERCQVLASLDALDALIYESECAIARLEDPHDEQ